MASFLTIVGSAALSGFRQQRAFDRLKQIESRLTALDSRHVHYLWLERPASAPEIERLHRALKREFDPAGILNPGRLVRGL